MSSDSNFDPWIPVCVVVVMTSVVLFAGLHVYLWYVRRQLVAFCLEKVCVRCCGKDETTPLVEDAEPPAELEMMEVSDECY
ncbi:protein UL148A [Human betaherpesvirus 5]|nr:protein UL148A [Human betaherpesvirus 5]